MVNVKKRNEANEQFNRQKTEKSEDYLDKLRRLQVDMNNLQKITKNQVEMASCE